MSLVHLFYVSAARTDLERRDFADIVTSARNNNPRLGVTGMLLFINGLSADRNEPCRGASVIRPHAKSVAQSPGSE